MITKKYYKMIRVSYEDEGYFYVKNVSNTNGTLTFKNTQLYAALSLKNHGFEYSTDGANWFSLDPNDSYLTLTVAPDTNVYMRANGEADIDSRYRDTINMDVDHIIGGNIMSLADKTNFASKTSILYRYVFYQLFKGDTHLISAEKLNFGNLTTLSHEACSGMFQGCTSLTTAPALPMTTLAYSCYSNMFKGCTSLTSAPELPAETLAVSCYSAMFYNCTALTTAPALPATTLAQQCYSGMFGGCSSLTSITCLATDISASNSTYYWVNGVAANGTFTKAASMNDWTTGTDGIPSGWTVVDA